MKRSTRRLLCLFAIPAALFVADFVVRVWRFPNASLLSHVEFYRLFIPIGALIAAAVGVLWLLLAQLAALISRRRNERKAACFLLPTLVVFSLYAALLLWGDIGFAAETRGLERMERIWEAESPQTADDVRRVFGEPYSTMKTGSDREETWYYHPTSLPVIASTPFQVFFHSDGTVLGHGYRHD